MRERIAILTPGHLPVPAIKGGAVETLITYLIEANEVEHKYDIDLYTIDDKSLENKVYNNTNLIRIKNLFVFRCIFKVLNTVNLKLNINKLYNYFAIKAVKRMNAFNIKYDKVIVENNMIVYGELFNNYKYFKNTKKYFHIHNVIYENQERTFRHLFDIIADTADNIIAVSNYMKEYFKAKTGVEKIDVLFNCIDFNNYDASLNERKSEYRKELNIKENTYNFIFTGRCVEDKGVYELIKAFIRLSNIYDNCSLSICGIHLNRPNNFEKKVIDMAGDNENINLFNYTNHSNLVKIIATSDCVVIPSKCEEAFGVVALEAMAMEKCIISTNSGGLTEPLTNECSIIIDRINLEENIYNAMKTIMSDSNNAKKLAKNAYYRVNEIEDFNKKYYLKNFINKLKG